MKGEKEGGIRLREREREDAKEEEASKRTTTTTTTLFFSARFVRIIDDDDRNESDTKNIFSLYIPATCGHMRNKKASFLVFNAFFCNRLKNIEI